MPLTRGKVVRLSNNVAVCVNGLRFGEFVVRGKERLEVKDAVGGLGDISINPIFDPIFTVRARGNQERNDLGAVRNLQAVTMTRFNIFEEVLSPVFYTASGWGEQGVLRHPLRTFFRCCAWVNSSGLPSFASVKGWLTVGARNDHADDTIYKLPFVKIDH